MYGQAAARRILRRRSIAGGESRDSQARSRRRRFEPAQLGGGLDGRVGGGPGRRDVALDTPARCLRNTRLSALQTSS